MSKTPRAIVEKWLIGLSNVNGRIHSGIASIGVVAPDNNDDKYAILVRVLDVETFRPCDLPEPDNGDFECLSGLKPD